MAETSSKDAVAPAGTTGRLRNMSVSAASKVMDLNPQLGMWKATGTAIAHAPNLKDLTCAITGGDNIVFDENGHSARQVPREKLEEKKAVARVQSHESASASGPVAGRRSESPSSAPVFATTVPETHIHRKEPWDKVIAHGSKAAGKFILTPTGFFITVYGLNVVAWGAMLFFLLLKAAPAMNHPDDGDADSSPRKIWIEIDSQILNALFCLTSFGLAPWRFRDLWWAASWRAGWGPENGRAALKKLAARNSDWFRVGDRTGDEEKTITFTGNRAPPTAGWKLDLVVWLMVFNSLFQVGMAFMMWHYNRIDRPTWGSGLFIGLGCGVSMFAGIISWWEGRKIKKIEGPKVLVKPLEDV